MNERELREVIRAELGRAVSSRLVDDRMKEAYESLGEMPGKKRDPARKALKWAGSALGGLAAAFAILVGLSAADPALAASIPGMEGIVAFLKGDRSHAGNPVVEFGGVQNFVQPVAQMDKKAFQVTETYFDGKTLVFSAKLTLPDPQDGYRIVSPQYELHFTADGEELYPEYDEFFYYSGMTRISRDAYVGVYTADIEDLPESFELTVGIKSITAMDDKLWVWDKELQSYQEKKYELDFTPEPVACTVKKDESLKRVYEVNEMKNGCTLKRIVVTPALTEIEYDIGGDTGETGIVMLAYDSDGKALSSMPKYKQHNGKGEAYYQTLGKDVTGVTVKFFHKDNRYDPIAEFTVPVEGGYYEEAPVNEWNSGDGAPIVYDPPLPDDGRDPNMRNWDNVQVVDLGETFSPKDEYSGSVDVTFDNLRYYSDWRKAGIEDRDTNCFDSVMEAIRENKEDFTFVLLDVTFQTHNAVRESAGECGYAASSFAECQWVDWNAAGELGNLSYQQDPCYFSGHADGISNYYCFDMEENETKTFQVGYMVPTEELIRGNFQIYCISSDLVWEEESVIAGQRVVNYSYGGYLVNIPALGENKR